MPKSEIPDDVRRFVLMRIPSVPHIEALLLLRASAPSQWSAHDLAQRLYVRPAIAELVLAEMHQAGIVHAHASSCYSYERPRGTLGDVIDELAAFYSTHLVEVTTLIHSKLERKAQQFADAFDFRKES